jgi:tRNA-Thr(GGU) m(6)t(6)A37 methyltransferase TsaA
MKNNKINVVLKIIGIIHSKFKTLDETSRQGSNTITKIEIFKKFEEGLRDIEGFSHIHVFFWLHKSKGYKLIVETPWDKNPHGVFTTRSPNRSNSIAYSVVELIERRQNTLKVKGIEAIDKTPVIDIKPYIEKIDSKGKTISGWFEEINLIY